MHGAALTILGIIVGAVLSIAAIAAGIITFRRQRKITSVDYQVVADIRLIESSAADAFANHLEVTYNSQPVTHPRIV